MEIFIFHYPGFRPIVNQTISLHVGCDLVGYPSFAFHNRTEELNNLQFGTDIDFVNWYDVTSGSWHFMEENDVFAPRRGYWMHSLKEIVWELPL